MNRRNLFTAGAGAAGAAALGAAAIGAVARPTPAGASQGRIPDVPVWTHEGHRVRFYDDLVRGRVVTLNFMFVGCGGVCPLVTENLRRVQELLGDRVGRDVFMFSVTLRPEL